MARQSRRNVGTDLATGPGALACSLASLTTLSRDTLVARWGEAFGRSPPKGMSRRLLERAVAYQLQVQASGELKPDVLRKLRRHTAAKETNGDNRSTKSTKLAPGTRLIREWNGRNHIVEVMADGFLWNDGTYQSLSAVARAITGARWSGPRFFGL